ncbi:MAG: ABC transporter permease [Bacteroidetes bacterium]|nr:ABC transporter permease [Bacteroidota bacterium]
MFKNYIVSAIRNITKSPFYAFLNILGLTIGLAAFIFILIYVSDEISYDKYNVNHSRIHRLESDFTIGSKHDKFAIVPIPMGPALKLEFPEIEETVRFRDIDNALFIYNDKEYYEDNFYYTDSTVFDVFTTELIVGELNHALVEPNTAVLTEKIALKYFGKENAIGKVIKTGSGRQYKITAVVKNQPENSHLKFDGLLSASTLAKEVGEDEFNSMEPVRFWNIGVFTYVMLHKNSSMETIHSKFPAFYDKYMKSLGDVFNASFNLMSTPLADVHLNSNLSSDLPTGNKAYVYIFSIVAIFILLLAAINYMNMATAQSSSRSREVGMRKVMGAYKRQLIGQFLSESVLLALIANILALAVVYIFLPDFNNLTGKELSYNLIMAPDFLGLILAVSLVIGLLSGSYPAFYLSSFMPLNVLKGITTSSGKPKLLLRRGLVVIQFFIAIVMIIGTFVVSDQLDYLRNKDLGFDKENLVVMELQDSAFRSKVEVFKEALLQSPNIEKVSNSTGVPGDVSWIQVMLVEQESEMKEFAVILAQCDYDYAELLGLEFIEGRDFDEKMGTDDSAAVIINETAARQFGWLDDPIGKKIHYGMELDRSGGRHLNVIGMVEDFHFTSLHNKVEPIILFISSVPRYYVTARVRDGNMITGLEHIEKCWNETGAERPFNYTMITDLQEEMYEGEEKISSIFLIISALTVFIALLGLFGLSSFTAEQRTREIGIRKVNGATLYDILILLYKEFFWLILIAFLIAVPIAYWRLSIWLETSFMYYTEIHWMSILTAGISAMIVGLLTISYHVVKVASSDPVEAIKYE